MAVTRGDEVLAEIAGDPTVTHGQRLPGELARALQAAAVGVEDIGLLAVVAGPGSFTGLRVGIASIQGLAFARALSVVPVSTFEALAHEAAARAADRAMLIAPWVDAQRGEVFATLYTPQLDAAIVPPSSAAPERTLQRWHEAIAGRSVLFAGDGAVRYRQAIAAALGGRAVVMEPVALAARAARIAARQPHRAVLPHALVPVYVRRPDAELARERSAAGHAADDRR